MDRKIGQVYETTEYDRFRFLPNNRAVITKGARWKSLLESLERFGQLEPALVTPHYEVINGQHRLTACKQLGIPFRYTFGDAQAGAEHIASVNKGNAWSGKDFINFYAADNSENSVSYHLCRALMTEFNLAPSTVINIIYRGFSAFINKKVQNGTLSLSWARYEEVRECLSDLFAAGFMDFAKERKIRSTTYWLAASYCWLHKDVDIKRLGRLLPPVRLRQPRLRRPRGDLLQGPLADVL